MSDDFLKIKLQRVIRRYQWFSLWRKLAAFWAAAALLAVGVDLLQRELGWSSPHTVPLFAAPMVAIALGLAIKHFQSPPDLRWIAQRIEKAHPELNGVLLTAVQHGLAPGVEPGFLQYRLLQEASARSQEQDWRQVFPTRRFVAGQVVHLIALACFVYALSSLHVNFTATQKGKDGIWVGSDGILVNPGDTSIEKGDSLVVLARFQKALPPTVTLVVRESGTSARTVPLIKSLADPVFGGSVPDVASDLLYHLEYRGQRTRDFKVSVFEHPKLVRADADLTFPDYTKLPKKHIEDTRRVSAVEGTKVDYALQLNKPVKSAKLVARDDKKVAINLEVDPAKAVANLKNFTPEKTRSYDLQLIDADGRANKVAAPFVIDVQPNRPPELRLASPRGDQRPSALEEVAFEGTVFDDFGSPAYGIAYSVSGAETKFIELGRDLAAKDKKTFNTVLKLEDLGAKPEDLISWYAWADDVGPDGKVRRTAGDLYFAEVRPFDEVFRESQDMQQEQQNQQQQQQQGNQRRRLTDIQKQIINATWKLQRDGMKGKYAEDVKVVLDAQTGLIDQAQEPAGEAQSPREQALWKEALQQMTTAVDRLKEATKATPPLAQALPAEQAAYQSLLKLQPRETNVTRSRNQRGGGGGGGQNQRQIDQLDLRQAENRYETQRQARNPQQNQERREQLAVMNRLQELARRQQDLNERLKELQTSLQEARTEKEKEDIQKRLKRLEEEQRQMLADADEVRQRMDRAENQSNMSDQRRELDQTREDIQRAADAAAQGNAAQALASGTRAQRQLQQMRDEMRKENSSQFAEDLREMRNEARELSRQQEDVGQKLDQLAGGMQRKSLGDQGGKKELLDTLEQQKDRMNKLVERAQQVSEQSENSEPLLSKQLYDSVRKVSQDDATSVKQAKQDLLASGMMTRNLADQLQQAQDRDAGGRAIDITKEILREGFTPQASQANQRARAELDELKKGVERAAESVLGDEAEQLRMAQSELDTLSDQLRREMDQATNGLNGQQKQGGRQAGQPGQPGQRGGRQQQGDQRMAGGQDGPQQPGGENGGEPGQAGQQADEQNGQPGQSGQKGGRAGQRGGQQRGLAQSDQQPQNGQRGAGQQQVEQGQSGQPGQQPGEQQGQGGQAGQGGQQGQQSLAQNSEGQQGQQGQGGQQPGGQPQGGQQPGGQQGGQQQGGQRGGRAGGSRLAGGARGGDNQRGDPNGQFNVGDLLNRNPGGRGGGGAYDDRGWNGGEWGNGGVLTGEDFNRWAERLRDTETLLDAPDLREQVARALERARTLRRDFKNDLKKPDWTVVQLEILKPLVEVRGKVTDELARRDSRESLAPIDRDPVPNRFAESVRKYYEELGKDRPAEAVR